MKRFTGVIAAAVREGVSDIHITGAHPVVYRKNGQIQQDRSIKWTHAEAGRPGEEAAHAPADPAPAQGVVRRCGRHYQHVRLRLNVSNT